MNGASSARADRVRRATALLAVARGRPFVRAARAAGIRLAGPALSTLHVHDNAGARDEQVTILRALGLSRQAEGAMG
jgi:hypothetical protein